MGLTSSSTGSNILNEFADIRKSDAYGLIVALAGNPNVGKSTVFNALTNMRQHTGNWPGKTVSGAYGTYIYNGRENILVDTPGTYSLFALSAEEEVTRDFISSGKADVTVIVCDASSLERNLNLVLQILSVTSHAVVCVNLTDEAAKKGIYVDIQKLEQILGVPVAATSAISGDGLDILLEKIEFAASHELTPYKLPALSQTICSACRFCGNDSEKCINFSSRQQTASAIFSVAEDICRKTVTFSHSQIEVRQLKADKLLTGRSIGIPAMLLLLAAVFYITITGANIPSAFLSSVFSIFGRLLDTTLFSIGCPEILHSILLDGIYRTLSWVISFMLPPMAIFFPLFTLLEDLGYLPRIAFNLDNIFCKCGACGKQSLTMCMGFGCNAAGVVGCRIIDSPRERLVAIITNSFVPCNGRFPTMIALISIFFVGSTAYSSVLSAILLTFFILLGIFTTLFISRILSATILKGFPSAAVLEIPPFRRPQIGRIIVQSIFDRTLFVLGRAAATAAPAGLLIWLMANISTGDGTVLSACTDFLDPFAKIFGLDGVILTAFILALPANEILLPIIIMSYTAAGSLTDYDSLSYLRALLIDNGWTSLTALNTMLFSLMHWPCATTLLTIKKETGSLKWTLISFVVPTLCGLILCFITTFVYRILF